MPNHVTHRMQIFGSESDRKAFEAAHFVNGGLDFQTIIPQPPSVTATESSTSVALWFYVVTGTFPPSAWKFGTPSLRQYGWVPNIITTAAELEPWLTKKEPTGRAKAEAMIACLRETGHESWYEWCNEHWGTKWNAYSCRAIEHKDGVSVVTFETAWSPPTPVLRELAKRWPGLIFDVTSYDEGDNFACVGQFNGRNDYRRVAVSPELYEKTYGHKRPTDEESDDA